VSATAPRVGERDDRGRADPDAGEPASTQAEPDGRTSTPAHLLDRHRTEYWRFAAVGGFLSAGLGVLFVRPALVLVAVVCVGTLALGQLATPPTPVLSVSRSFSTTQPAPGDSVEVETTITNVSDSTLSRCVLVDLVPDELRVVAGSPRLATALRPGERCTIEYAVEASRGYHRFDGVYTVVSDVADAHEHEYTLAATDAVQCRPEPEPLEVSVLRSLATPYAGRLATEQPGEGLEFHSVREYRPGDSLRRIDWNQYATTRSLTTVQFRTERSAAVVLVADVRPEAYVRARAEDSHAADRCVEAVGRLFVTLLDADHRVGIATLGPEFWLAPDTGTEHRDRGLDALGGAPALSPSRPSGGFPVRLRAIQLLQRLASPTQLIVCTPLVDDVVEVPIQLFESAGHEVTVISPDPTRLATPGDTVTALERRERIGRIHSYGVPVVDWPLDEPLAAVLARTVRRP